MTKDTFLHGVEQFNAGRFFEAHESWEEVWLKAAEPERTHLQGLIQITAAFHHYRHGNLEGARRLLESALLKLSDAPDVLRGIKLGELEQAAAKWLGALDGPLRPSLPEPRIELAGHAANGVED